jgi:hypothetical protein
MAGAARPSGVEDPANELVVGLLEDDGGAHDTFRVAADPVGFFARL